MQGFGFCCSICCHVKSDGTEGEGGEEVELEGRGSPCGCRGCTAAAEGPHGNSVLACVLLHSSTSSRRAEREKKRREKRRGEKENIAAKST